MGGHLESEDYESKCCSVLSALGSTEKKCMELQETIRDLDKEKDILAKDNNTLQQTIKASQNQKDSQLFHLHRKVRELEKHNAVKDGLCTSLTEEADSLKIQLQQTSEKCQEMMYKLDERTSGHRVGPARDRIHVSTSDRPLESRIEDMQQQTVPSVSSSGEQSELVRDLIKQNDHLNEQSERANKKLVEVSEMNTRWQQYNRQREHYVQRLQDDKAMLQIRVEEKEDPNRITTEEKQKMDKLLLEATRKQDELERSKQKLTEKNVALEEKCLSHREAIHSLKSEVGDLQEQLEERSLRGANMSVGKVEALEHQVQLFREDFECERRDRERAQETIERLRDELRIANSQVEAFQSGSMAHLYTRRNIALRNYEDSYEQRHRDARARNEIPEVSLVARGIEQHDGEADVASEAPWMQHMPHPGINRNIVYDSPPQNHTNANMDDNEEGFDEIDSGELEQILAKSQMGNKRKSQQDEIFPNRTATVRHEIPLTDDEDFLQSDDLQCPKCQKIFKVYEHSHLLKHIDLCCD